MEGQDRKLSIDKTAELYNNRFDDFGRDIKTVGWGSQKDQRIRFEMLFRGIDPTGKTILDVGCGLGDLIPFLEEQTNDNFNYIGIDIAEKLIENAKAIYSKEGRVFYVGDIFSTGVPDVDISVLSGALSFKMEGIEEYAYQTMKKMFDLSREAASLNFLSKYVDFELKKNQHYHPEMIFSKAKALSKRVNLFHDYPLYEFTLQIIKAN